MNVDSPSGACRLCAGELRVIDGDDATLTVECTECGDTYLIEPETGGDGRPIYCLSNEADGTTARFPLGQIVITPNALNHLPSDEVLAALQRHVRGDWGDVDDHDRQENELSLRQGFRLLSAYQTRAATKFWIITEADRSATTVLLPEDY
jgi:hypothetical protein